MFLASFLLAIVATGAHQTHSALPLRVPVSSSGALLDIRQAKAHQRDLALGNEVKKDARFMRSDASSPIAMHTFAQRSSSRQSLPLTLVTVSEHFGQMLTATLPCNVDHVERVIVVTTSEDSETHAVCQRMKPKVKCYSTKALHANKAPFNKGMALNEVQQILHQDPDMQGKLVLLADPDICVPDYVWTEIPQAPQPNVIYTMTRRCIYLTPEEAQEGNPSELERVDISHPDLKTMGFFQLYMVSADSPMYATKYRTAAESDTDFGHKFAKVVRLPGFVHHLGHIHKWNGVSGQEHNWATATIPKQNACPQEYINSHDDAWKGVKL